MRNLPIGVFDSGMGGLSVVKQINSRLPMEGVIYVADSARFPYGTKPLEQVREFSIQILKFLLDVRVKAVVIGCNTATAAAYAYLKKISPVPVLGVIEPGARAAIVTSVNKKIGVISTTGTAKSGAHVAVISKLDPCCEVFDVGCPNLADLVEQGNPDPELTQEVASGCLWAILSKGIDTLVLGCTHFPFIRNEIGSAAGRGISLVDPAEQTVVELETILRLRGLLANTQVPSRFYTTGDPGHFARLGSSLLGYPIEQVHFVHWEAKPLASGETGS